MIKRQTIAFPEVIRVDALCSIYRFDLSAIDPRGDLHDFYELVYVEEGLFSVLVDGVPYEIPAGSLFVYAPNAYHVGNAERKNTAVVSIVSFCSRSESMHWFDNRALALTEEERERTLSFFGLAREVLTMSGPYGLSLRRQGTAHQLQLVGNRLEELLLSLYREETPSPAASGRRAYKKEQFLRLSHYLKQHLSEHHSLLSMAESMSCSVSTVKALCREFCGAGPNEYLISLRIGRARELIREGAMTFTEIAEVTGFGTIHYFSRIFKSHTGQTPTEYAAMVLG